MGMFDGWFDDGWGDDYVPSVDVSTLGDVATNAGGTIFDSGVTDSLLDEASNADLSYLDLGSYLDPSSYDYDYSSFAEPSVDSFANVSYDYPAMDSLVSQLSVPSISTAELNGFEDVSPVAADQYLTNAMVSPSEATLLASDSDVANAFSDPVQRSMLLNIPSMSTAQLDGFQVTGSSGAPAYIGTGSDFFNQYYNPTDGVVPTNAGIPVSWVDKLLAPSTQVIGSAAQRALMSKLGLLMPTKSNLASGIGAGLLAAQVAGAFGSDAKAPTPTQNKTKSMSWNKSIATDKARGGVITGRTRPVQGALGLLRGTQAGQADGVPVNASHGEYVMDADTVSALGDGNTEAGAARLDNMRQNIRSHKRSAPSNKIPPKAKRPESYLKGGK